MRVMYSQFSAPTFEQDFVSYPARNPKQLA